MYEDLKIPESYDALVLDVCFGKEPLRMLRSHHHEEIELNIVTKGSAAYLIEGRRYDLKPGVILWIPSMLEHQLIDIQSGFSFHVVAYQAHYTSKRMYNGDGKSVLKSPVLKYLPSGIYQTIDSVVRQLFKDTGLKDTAKNAIDYAGVAYGRSENLPYNHSMPAVFNAGANYIFQLAWAVYRGSFDEHFGYELHSSVLRARELLDSGNTDLSVEQISQISGLSPHRISRLFKAQIGIPISEYRNQVRLRQFLILYEQTEWGQRNITRLAYEAGFGSYAQFYKYFVSSLGFSPGELKNK